MYVCCFFFCESISFGSIRACKFMFLAAYPIQRLNTKRNQSQNHAISLFFFVNTQACAYCECNVLHIIRLSRPFHGIHGFVFLPNVSSFLFMLCYSTNSIYSYLILFYIVSNSISFLSNMTFVPEII